MKELDLIEKKELRDGFIDRMEVLDKVGELILLPSIECATTEQVADYYKVSKETINSLVNDNREELELELMKTHKKTEIKRNVLLEQNVKVLDYQGFMEVEYNGNLVKISNRGARLFPKRAILRVGMLLRDSEVAKEIRTRLLDIVQDIEQGKTDIIDNVMAELTEEKQIMMERMNAELAGDFDAVCVANAKLFALKNKRIAELEAENQFITTSKLTITESKSVINRIIRKIAFARYNGNFKSAFGEFYSNANYRLHINVNNRQGKGLNRFNDEEIYELEKMARNWAIKIGLDLDDLLKLA